MRALLKNFWGEGSDEESLDLIVPTADAMGESGADLAWLAAFDLDPDVARAASSIMLVVLKDEDVRGGVRDRMRKSAAPVLLEALERPGVPDERKYSLAPLYELCAGEVPADQYESFFDDYAGTMQRIRAEMAGAVSGDPQGIEQVLAAMGYGSEQGAEPEAICLNLNALAGDMLEAGPAPAATLAAANAEAAWGEGVRGRGIDAALSLIEAADCPRAAWLLAELSRWPGLGELTERAGRLALKMRLGGTTPHYGLGCEFSRCLASGPDGMGSRQLVLFFNMPDGGTDALVLLLNDTAGVKDVWCAYGDVGQLEERFAEFAPDILMAGCSFAMARELFADAWVIHEEQGTRFPPLTFVYRPYLGEEPIVPARRIPDLSAYGLDELERNEDLFRGSAKLAALPCYSELSFASKEAYDFVAGVMPERSLRLPKKTFDKFLREAAIGEKDMLMSRIAGLLEVESWAGRAKRKVNRVAAAAWLGMTEEVLPFDRGPFIRALGEEAVAKILNNLRLGFRSQEEANQAAMAMDAQYDDEI